MDEQVIFMLPHLPTKRPSKRDSIIIIVIYPALFIIRKNSANVRRLVMGLLLVLSYDRFLAKMVYKMRKSK